jgi:hypothetical protein
MRQRSKMKFRPELEQSEARMLLSGAGAAHADVAAARVAEVARGFAYYLTISLRPTTPIYSLVVFNNSHNPLITSVSGPGGRTINTNIPNGTIIPARGRILLFTNDPEGALTINVRTPDNRLSGSFTFHADEGKQTSIQLGYAFPVEARYANNSSPAHSNPFQIVLQGTARNPQLAVEPGSTPAALRAHH